jgi:HD-GYP domain-containing protein (c-di-GMP phosphodiesterase class II)
MDREEMDALRFAALLHDIGKIGIGDNVLLKNGSFTPEERAEMNTHTIKTKEILEKFRFPKALRSVPEIAVHHHEWIDGSGYPDGMTGDMMPLGSKILAVADVFDALTSRREYPKYAGSELLSTEPMPLQKAISILEMESGTHFEPEVVAAFMKCLPRALLLYRGEHFDSEYVDETIRKLAPYLLKD